MRGRQLKLELAPLALGFMADVARDIPADDLDTTLRTLRRMQANILGAAPAEDGQQAAP